MQVNKADNAIHIWSVTLHKNDIIPEMVIEWASKNCSKWVFQLERGEKGLLHYQCTFDFLKKVRFPELPEDWKGSCRPYQTSEVRKGAHFDYAMKEDTRLDGPWSNLSEPDFIPSDVEGTILRPWQQRCLDMLFTQNNREIMFVHDEKGGVGKTHFMEWCIYNKRAIDVPTTCTEVQQMVGAIIGQIRDPREKRLIMMEIPRAWSGDDRKMCNFIGLLEAIKSGRLVDGRNFAKRKVFEKPYVCVFFNRLPKGKKISDYMSEDRIMLWTDFACDQVLALMGPEANNS